MTPAPHPLQMDIEGKIIKDFCEHPKLKRGKVWCINCGKELLIDPEVCMKRGWPKCCGQTMTIDSPAELRQRGREQ